MRHGLPSVAAIALVAAMVVPGHASAQTSGSVEGFGGLPVNGLQSQPLSLGGTVTFDLIPSIQIVGEAGRIGNVLPPIANAAFSLAQADLQASAVYGQGGVRLLAAPRSPVTPYAEATAGVAHLNVSSGRLNALENAATSLALSLVGTNSPVAGVGGGVLLRTGPIVFDLGYRYAQLFGHQVLRDVLGFGQPLHAHEFRAGVGVRF